MYTGEKTPDGRVIIAREVATGPHPHPRQNGKIIEFTGMSRLLLEDETVVFGCDECGKTHVNFRSIFGHMSSHNTDRARSPYDEKTLRAVATAVRRNWDSKGRCMLAAVELNEKGFVTARGEPWTAQNVSAIFNKHCTNIRVHIRRGKRESHTEDIPTGSTGPTGGAAPDTVKAARSMRTPHEIGYPGHPKDDELGAHAQRVVIAYNAMVEAQSAFEQTFVGYMRAVASVDTTPPPIDPELLKKAQNWDRYIEFQQLVNSDHK